ncbi:MAG: type II secretion system protein [Verrucomicrobiota bacterium]
MHPRNAHPSGSRRSIQRSVAGFTLIELVAAVAVISLLMVLILPALAKAQTKMRSNRCVSNLQDIGTALNMYLQDSNDKLPYAALRYTIKNTEHHLAWDDLMGPYLGIDMTVEQRSQDGASGTGSFKLLLCPQDILPVKSTDDLHRKESRRSYALPEHNLGLLKLADRPATAADWPPCPVNQTGIGIRLDGRPSALSPRWNSDDEPGGPKAPRWQPAYVNTMIMDTPNTLFMTERFDSINRVGSWNGAAISDISTHIGEVGTQPVQAQFNYLMTDGHVENLAPQDSYASRRRTLNPSTKAAPAGIWTVWQDD